MIQITILHEAKKLLCLPFKKLQTKVLSELNERFVTDNKLFLENRKTFLLRLDYD